MSDLENKIAKVEKEIEEAKTKMANTLNMTPPNQQFGYGNTYNDTYARKMNNTNVFYNYLNEQGLI